MYRVLIAVALLLGLGTAQAAEPFADCTTASFASRLGRSEVFQCVEIRRLESSLAGAAIPVRTLRTSEDGRSAQYEPDVVDAIETAFQAFSELGGIGQGSVTVVFDLPLPQSVKAGYAWAGMLDLGNSSECVVMVNTVRHDIDPNAALSGDVMIELRNTLAHELFHCVQNWAWPGKMPSAVGKDAKWWVEGTAELMGHLVFESSGTLKARGADFASLSRVQPLTTIEYPNLVFFSWLWTRGGPGGLVDFIGAMPDAPGEENQRAALVAAVGDAALAQFVADYADGKVTSPAGTPFGAPAGVPVRTIDAAGPAVLKVAPLTVFIQDVAFAGGRYMATGGGSPRLVMKPVAGGVWEVPMMIATEATCDAPEVYRFAGMSFGAAPGGSSTAEDYTLDVTQISKCQECAVDSDAIDQCLVGEWKIANESLAEALRLQQEDDLVQVIVGGDAAARFGKDGRNLLGFSKYSVEGVATVDGSVRFRIYLAGTIDSLYAAKEGHLKMCYRDSEAMIQIVGSGGGQGEPMPFSSLPLDRTFEADYTCSGDEMMLTQKIGDGDPFTIRFTRLHGMEPRAQ
ncbi:MAG: hypothetical protein IT548_04275 [Alphaproteobacteria bacterium]|nr:hypothetical protein [Alphaproteobacteria bacterium]